MNYGADNGGGDGGGTVEECGINLRSQRIIDSGSLHNTHIKYNMSRVF